MSHTKAELFLNDPRIAEAKKLIQNALTEHQKDITTIHGPVSPEKNQIR
jgi:hypothetical protein